MRIIKSRRTLVVSAVAGIALLSGVLAAVFAQGGGEGELPVLGLRVIGQTELLADSPASLRIIVT
ncbi:MAG: hypothetical protein J7M38_04230, partial [Armatimonadetes bacterium]|nr:hypothetical protein [Armatimonadota bacterium]